MVILSGEGKHFSSGIDLVSATQIGAIGSEQETPDPARAALRIGPIVDKLQRNVTSFESCRVPVIGVAHGYCIGAAIDILSACDIRIAAEDAKFTIKEVDIGICADIGTIQRF